MGKWTRWQIGSDSDKYPVVYSLQYTLRNDNHLTNIPETHYFNDRTTVLSVKFSLKPLVAEAATCLAHLILAK